ncbi:putative Aminoglycoside phosphotransferase domain-containing protein [Seiridium unicorne]|uniref:Aminoglycoside phosphotransferase domain-containing protein n=1 Tax=Seiridium unicorne TaxID=138068 RepID=A0ABR2UVG6_9PEZI
MNTVPQDRSLTPPHNPIHGVELTTPDIETLLKKYGSNLDFTSVIEPPSTRSWNNRIYLLSVSDKHNHARIHELVLKVNGRLFGPEKVEKETQCGNIRFRANDHEGMPPDVELAETIHESPFELVIRGVLRDNIKGPAAGNSREDGFVFTHYDLSLRNVLTSGTPAHITGIVVPEFAGFMSPIEEFLNDHVNNDGDWLKPVYNAYLERLENNGIATLMHGITEEHWQQALWLEQFIHNITPW